VISMLVEETTNNEKSLEVLSTAVSPTHGLHWHCLGYSVLPRVNVVVRWCLEFQQRCGPPVFCTVCHLVGTSLCST